MALRLCVVLSCRMCGLTDNLMHPPNRAASSVLETLGTEIEGQMLGSSQTNQFLFRDVPCQTAMSRVAQWLDRAGPARPTDLSLLLARPGQPNSSLLSTGPGPAWLPNTKPLSTGPSRVNPALLFANPSLLLAHFYRPRLAP